jgi:outer membrane protein
VRRKAALRQFAMPFSPRAAAAIVTLAIVGCGHVAPGRFVADRVPDRDPGPAPAAVADAPPRPPAAAAPSTTPPPPEPRSLDDLLERALAQDPEARAAFHDARSAAASAGSRRSEWYPQLDAAADIGRSSVGGGARTRAGVSASLSWLLLDLGARGASIDQADQLLLAARFARRASILDLVLQVEETYYLYLGARALVAAQQSAVKQADTVLAAAEDRRRAGLATIADVLQARTAQSQARLRLQELEGQALAFRGALATLAGLPPTAALEVGELPRQLAHEEAEPEVERLLSEAAARNPDLGRARALSGAADASARFAARAGLPTLSFGSAFGRGWTLRPDDGADTTWTLGFTLRFPIFEGFRTVYDTIAARESAAATRAREEATGRQVFLDVWTSHQALRTAGLRLETSRVLVEDATLSAEVAAARYKEGVGSILDLLTARAALENARAEDVRARADWLVSFARLARTTGRLDPTMIKTTGDAR